MHLGLNVCIMDIGLTLVFRFTSAFGFSCSRQDGLEHLFPQNEQGGHFPQAFGHRFIAARVVYFADQVFAAQFFQVIGSLTRGVIAGNVYLDFGGQVCALEAVRSGGQSNHSLQDGTHSGLVDIHAPDTGLANLGRLGAIVQAIIRDGNKINAAQGIQETIQDFFQSQDDLGEFGQRAATMQFFGIVNDDLNAQDAFAFGVHLGGNLPEVYLEHRQVILRSLDHDFAARLFFVLAAGWTPFGSEDGLQGFDIEQASGAINGTLKNLLQLTTSQEEQITTVFFLVDRVVVVQTGLFLLGQIQSKAQASRVNPTLTYLAQAPYDVWRTQGVCDLRQSCGVGDLGETIAFLGKLDAFLSGLTSHVLMSIQDDLCAERRMTAHLDGDMSPIGVENVERVVVHIRVLSGKVDYFAALGTLHIPNRRWRASNQDQKYADETWIFWKMFLGSFVFPLSWHTINQRNLVCLRMCANTTAKTSSHSHQMSIVQIVIRTHQLSPPSTEAAWCLTQAKVGVEDNPVHTVIGVVQQVSVIITILIQRFCHPFILHGVMS